MTYRFPVIRDKVKNLWLNRRHQFPIEAFQQRAVNYSKYPSRVNYCTTLATRSLSERAETRGESIEAETVT